MTFYKKDKCCYINDEYDVLDIENCTYYNDRVKMLNISQNAFRFIYNIDILFPNINELYININQLDSDLIDFFKNSYFKKIKMITFNFLNSIDLNKQNTYANSILYHLNNKFKKIEYIYLKNIQNSLYVFDILNLQSLTYLKQVNYLLSSTIEESKKNNGKYRYCGRIKI